MKACILAINSGHDRVMAYASYKRCGAMSLKASNAPVITKNKNILVGVTNNEKLLTDLQTSPLMLGMDVPPHEAANVIRNSILKGYTGKPGVLVLTSNNFVYHWTEKSVDCYSEFDQGYLAIGDGHEIAMGAMYGLRSSRFTVQNMAEIAIQAVTEFYPELGQSTGVFTL